MRAGEDVWRIDRADRVSVIVDADDYFRNLRQAMLQAKRRIMLVGWDFDARVVLDPRGISTEGPASVGAFISWLVEREPGLEVFILRWDLGAMKALLRGSTFVTLIRWMRHPRIHLKLDGHHPIGASHHQKIVVIDDCLAFCGGIDVTGDRWDTRAHEDDEPFRKRPSGRPYPPWHDTIAAVSGPVARTLGTLTRDRWLRAGGELLSAVDEETPCWPDGLGCDFEGVEVGIARTLPESPDQRPVCENEALFLSQIAAAERWLYIESQYFASRRIAEAIARRLDEPDGPEVVLLNPESANGWLEPIAMDTARARLMAALQARDRYGRLRMYHPYTTRGMPIYCHAKVLVADDRVLRLGSSNLNNRSLRLDTECDLAIVAEDDRTRERVAAIRDGLIGEHLGVAPSLVAAALAGTGSLIATIERLRGEGGRLRPYEVPDLSAISTWLADNEVLDPEGPAEMFEPLSKRGLFRRRLRRG